MREIRRTVFFLTLLTFLAGCSGYERVNLSGEFPADGGESRIPPLKVGANAKVLLKSGAKETGEISAFTEESLTLSKPTNFGLKKITIPFAEIEKLEQAHSSDAINALTVVAGIAVLGLMVLLFSLRNADLS